MTYVIAKPANARRASLFVTKRAGNGSLIGIVPDHTKYAADRVTYRLTADEVVVPLGDAPPYGRVYGVLVEPIHDRWMVRGWGTVYCYVPSTSADMRERISRALVAARGKMNRQFPGCTDHDMMTSIRNPQGTTVGTYSFRPKGEDEFVLRPPAQMGSRELVKVISHELAHAVWCRLMTPEQRARWHKLYARYVHVARVSVDDVRAMLKGMRQIESVRDYLKDCEPEDQERAKIYLRWLGRVHTISAREVQDMISAGEDLPVPDVHLHRSDTSTPITLYSKSNSEEMFCESVSSHMVGDLSDKRILAMLEK